MGPPVPPQAIRSVYRAIARHCLRLNSDGRRILVETKSQFIRRRKGAKIGHVRAAYNLEAGLRDVCTGRMTLAALREKFTSNKKNEMEVNAEARYFLWRQHESRRLDDYNRVPQTPNDHQEVTRRSKIANLRANYLKARSLHGRNIVAVDTIFAPHWYKVYHDKQITEDEERRKNPRRVEIKSILRVGGALSLIRVQGIKMFPHGFRRHLQEVNRDWGKKMVKVSHQINIASGYVLEDASWIPWLEHLKSWRRNLVQQQREYSMKLQVQHQILVRRQQEMQRAWDWQHRRKRVPVKQPLRLKSLKQ